MDQYSVHLQICNVLFDFISKLDMNIVIWICFQLLNVIYENRKFAFNRNYTKTSFQLPI